ncbi:MAG TPA: response regulator transcription factor [Candidatus Methylomirabilis sp.]|nr:response regulator transcription factor [Candidatus Methylomirabilis sp.]
MTRTTILLADDHTIVRRGLRAMLEAEEDFAVIGEAASGSEVADLVVRLQPDVLVLDIMMPGLNGLEVTRKVSQSSPQTRIVVLSTYSNEAYVHEALRSGASGYVLKAASTAELVHAVRAVMTGTRYLSPPLSDLAIEAYLRKTLPSPVDLYSTLTAREQEVMQLAAQGRKVSEIAARLEVSPRTVETYRANIMRKLKLHSQGDLIRYALQRRIVPLDGELGGVEESGDSRRSSRGEQDRK